jgi:hypothetical protein
MATIRTRDGYKHMYECFMCGSDFQFGPHVYGGRAIGAWNISVCQSCYSSNHDGIVREQHPKLMAHLKEQGLGIQLNNRGWLSWPT